MRGRLTLWRPFGGPNSSTQDELQVLNSQGMIAGTADTSIPNHPNACLFCFSPFISHAFQWRNGFLHDLGALPGANSSGANWIADGGLVAGFSETDEIDPLAKPPFVGIRQMHAVLWKDGHITDLGTLEGGYESIAFAVNSRGQVAGAAFNTVPDPFSFLGTQQRVFLWQNGVMEDLGTLGGPDAGLVGSIKGNVEMNERGQVVACSYTNSTVNFVTGTPRVDPFLWENGTMLDLGTLGGTSGCAVYLNNRGQVVGYSNVAGDLTSHPFLWERGIMKDLGTLGGTFGFANWINDAGEVTGGATILGEALHAFSWKNGIMTDLGTLPGDVVSQPQAVNSRGQIVGASSQTPDFTANRAFLWESGGPMVDLNTLVISGLGVQLLNAFDINNRGEIDAVGVLPTGDTHAILLIPCDEKHPDVEGCDYSFADGTPTTDVTHRINTGSPITNSPAAIFARQSRIHREMLSGPQERMAPQFRNSSAALLSAPHNLTASPLNTYQIRINWQEAPGQNQTGFNVYRCHGCPSPRTEGTKIASVGPSVLSYTNGSSTSPLTETTSYTYQVTAFKGSGESTASNAGSATTGTEPAPTNLSSFAFTRGGIDDIVELHWTNNSTDDDSYFLESCSGPTCTNFSVIAKLPANTTSDNQFFQFAPDITIRYRVRAHSPGGFSAYSNIRNQLLP